MDLSSQESNATGQTKDQEDDPGLKAMEDEFKLWAMKEDHKDQRKHRRRRYASIAGGVTMALYAGTYTRSMRAPWVRLIGGAILGGAVHDLLVSFQ